MLKFKKCKASKRQRSLVKILWVLLLVIEAKIGFLRVRTEEKELLFKLFHTCRSRNSTRYERMRA
jgi:hypothetical protein